MIAATLAVAFSLTAVPARVQLAGTSSQVVEVHNDGSSRVVLDATRAGFALDLGGRPRVIAARPAPWLSVRPKRIAVPAGGTATLTVSGRVLHGASPGDHTALLLLSTRAPKNVAVAVRMRLGVVVVLRVPGTVVHRLAVQALHVTRRLRLRELRVSLANRGNVTELLAGKRVTVTVRRNGKVLARLRPTPRELLPHSLGQVYVGFRSATHGTATVEVTIEPATASGAVARRTFRATF